MPIARSNFNFTTTHEFNWIQLTDVEVKDEVNVRSLKHKLYIHCIRSGFSYDQFNEAASKVKNVITPELASYFSEIDYKLYPFAVAEVDLEVKFNKFMSQGYELAHKTSPSTLTFDEKQVRMQFSKEFKNQISCIQNGNWKTLDKLTRTQIESIEDRIDWDSLLGTWFKPL